MRALVACGWFGIQAWIGGEALHTFFTNVDPRLADAARRRLRRPHDDRVAVVPAVLGPERLHHLPRHGPAARGRELGGAVRAGDDRRRCCGGRSGARTASGRCWRSRASSTTVGEFLPVFVPSLTAMIGFWATLSLNMPDFTRFGRSQREQIVGQVVALPTTMSRVRGDGRDDHQRDGDHLRRVDLGSGPAGRQVHARRSSSRSRCSPSSSRRSRSTSPPTSCRRPTTSPTRFPRSISFKTGGLITGLARHRDSAVEAARRSVRLHLHLAARLLRRPRIDRRRARSPTTGSCGRRELRLEDLYLPDGAIATPRLELARRSPPRSLGCALAWGGLVVPALKPLYDYAWFVGFGVSARLVYLGAGRRGECKGRCQGFANRCRC